MARAAIVSHSFLDRDPRVRRAIDALLADGWDVDGLFLDPPRAVGRFRAWQVKMERRRGGAVRYAFEYGVFFLATTWWLMRRLARSRPDVVYVNSPPDALSLAAWPAKIARVPVILDIHDPMPELLASKGDDRSFFGRMLIVQERWGARFADRLITVHEPLRDLLQSRLGPVPMAIVMNVPDDAALPPIEWDADSRTVVYTGTVALRYGVVDLVDAIAEVVDDIPNIRLRIIGEGEDLDLVRDRAGQVGLGDRVEFRGRIPWEEVRDAQLDAWVGVNVPRPDDLGELSFSNKIVEWVTMGLPVVASRTSTLLRYFPAGTLRYVEAGSVGSLAEQLRALDTADPAEIVGEVERAQAALSVIDWPVQRESLLGVLRPLVG